MGATRNVEPRDGQSRRGNEPGGSPSTAANGTDDLAGELLDGVLLTGVGPAPGGGTGIEVRTPPELAQAYVDEVQRVLGDAPNYAECPVQLDGDPDRYVYTVRRGDGKTADQIRESLERDTTETRERLGTARDELHDLRATFASAAATARQAAQGDGNDTELEALKDAVRTAHGGLLSLNQSLGTRPEPVLQAPTAAATGTPTDISRAFIATGVELIRGGSSDTWECGTRSGGQTYVMALQRLEGLTPHQARLAAEDELGRARGDVDAFRSELHAQIRVVHDKHFAAAWIAYGDSVSNDARIAAYRSALGAAETAFETLADSFGTAGANATDQPDLGTGGTQETPSSAPVLGHLPEPDRSTNPQNAASGAPGATHPLEGRRSANIH